MFPILLILLVVALFLWGLSLLPSIPAVAPYTGWLAFICVLLLTIIVCTAHYPVARL